MWAFNIYQLTRVFIQYRGPYTSGHSILISLHEWSYNIGDLTQVSFNINDLTRVVMQYRGPFTLRCVKLFSKMLYPLLSTASTQDTSQCGQKGVDRAGQHYRKQAQNFTQFHFLYLELTLVSNPQFTVPLYKWGSSGMRFRTEQIQT